MAVPDRTCGQPSHLARCTRRDVAFGLVNSRLVAGCSCRHRRMRLVSAPMSRVHKSMNGRHTIGQTGRVLERRVGWRCALGGDWFASTSSDGHQEHPSILPSPTARVFCLLLHREVADRLLRIADIRAARKTDRELPCLCGVCGGIRVLTPPQSRRTSFTLCHAFLVLAYRLFRHRSRQGSLTQ
jgi:hypothetical protein